MSLKPYSVANRFTIDKIQISRVNMDLTLDFIDKALAKKNFGYVCVTNARTTYLANRNSAYCSIQNNSLLTVPDGMPLVWIANNFGLLKLLFQSNSQLNSHIFVNRADSGKDSEYMYQKFAVLARRFLDKMPLYAGYLHENQEVVDSVARQKSIRKIAPESDASVRILSLCKVLTEELSAMADKKVNTPKRFTDSEIQTAEIKDRV